MTSLADGLDKCSSGYGKLTDPIWNKDYRAWTDKREEMIWGGKYHDLTTEGDPANMDMKKKEQPQGR